MSIDILCLCNQHGGAELEQTDSPRCERCAGTTQYAGRISLPAMTIYRCDACGNDMWMQSNPHLSSRAPAELPQAQQQQQPQPDTEGLAKPKTDVE